MNKRSSVQNFKHFKVVRRYKKGKTVQFAQKCSSILGAQSVSISSFSLFDELTLTSFQVLKVFTHVFCDPSFTNEQLYTRANESHFCFLQIHRCFARFLLNKLTRK